MLNQIISANDTSSHLATSMGARIGDVFGILLLASKIAISANVAATLKAYPESFWPDAVRMCLLVVGLTFCLARLQGLWRRGRTVFPELLLVMVGTQLIVGLLNVWQSPEGFAGRPTVLLLLAILLGAAVVWKTQKRSISVNFPQPNPSGGADVTAPAH